MTNVLAFKTALDSVQITTETVSNLKSVKNDKTISTHLERIKAGKFEKREINALTKLVASKRFASPERAENIQNLLDLAMELVGDEYVSGNFQIEVMHFKKPMKISKEQSDLGKVWLTEFFFKKNGEKRGGKNTEFVSSRVLDISKSVKRFEFIGLRIVHAYGQCTKVLPIYRTLDSKGNYFDYAPIHWGRPVIMENY